jgi:hypothetical protein
MPERRERLHAQTELHVRIDIWHYDNSLRHKQAFLPDNPTRLLVKENEEQYIIVQICHI